MNSGPVWEHLDRDIPETAEVEQVLQLCVPEPGDVSLSSPVLVPLPGDQEDIPTRPADTDDWRDEFGLPGHGSNILRVMRACIQGTSKAHEAPDAAPASAVSTLTSRFLR